MSLCGIWFNDLTSSIPYNIFVVCCTLRQIIMSSCIAFAKIAGTAKVESELLPQMWEQVRTFSREKLSVCMCGTLFAKCGMCVMNTTLYTCVYVSMVSDVCTHIYVSHSRSDFRRACFVVFTVSLFSQITHKHFERRLLVAESCGVLAPYIPVSLT